MINDKRKVVLVGTGMVGMSYAYALLNQNVCDELVLLDLDKKRAEGEARVFDILASKKSLQAAPGFIFLSNLNFLLARYG